MTAPAPSTAAWREVLALFDHWAAAEPAQREAALQRVQAEQPNLYPRLLAMINADQAAEARDFLGDDATPVASEAQHAGRRLGAWELREPIGHGGMGEVWLATRSDGLYSGRSAVKLLHAAGRSAQAQARFAREGEFLARLSHPHIAQLLDAGLMPDSTRYLVLEYVAGERIDHWCDARKLTITERLRLFMQVCEAVSYAHTHLVVHRDLKPANILVSDDGHVKLLDFGVAKLLVDDDEGHEQTELTRAGAAGLTPEYAAPEQIEGQPITTATDVYALGVVLFGLLSGARPYASTSRGMAAMARAIVEEPPRSLTAAACESPDAAPSRSTQLAALTQALRGDLETIVAKALKKSPVERYATVQELREDLQRHLDHQPVSAQPDTFGYRARKFAQRNRVQVLALATVMFALLVGMGAATWQWRVATLEARRTRSVVQVMTGLLRGLNPYESDKATIPAAETLRLGWQHAKANLGNDAALQAETARTIGIMLAYSGDMTNAADALGVSHRQMAASGRTHSPEYLEVAFELGNARRRLGQSAAARALFEEVVALASAQDNPATRSWLVNGRIHLGEMALDEGRLDEAGRLLEQAATQARTQLGAKDYAYAKAMDSLATLARQQGRWDEARQMFAAVVQATSAGKPLDSAMARFSAATIDVEMGRYQVAQVMLREVVDDLTRLLGTTDTNTLYAQTWRSRALFHDGAFDESQRVLNQALAKARESGEVEVLHIVQVILARHALRQGDVTRAEPLLRESLAFFDAGGPTLRRDAERARALVAECLLRRGLTDQAIALLRQTQAAQLAIFNNTPHAEQWPTALLLALALDAQQGSVAAAEHYEQANQIADRLLPPGHPDRLKLHAFASYARWRKGPGPDTHQAARDALDAYGKLLASRSDRPSLSVLSRRMMSASPQAPLAVASVMPLLAY